MCQFWNLAGPGRTFPVPSTASSGAFTDKHRPQLVLFHQTSAFWGTSDASQLPAECPPEQKEKLSRRKLNPHPQTGTAALSIPISKAFQLGGLGSTLLLLWDISSQACQVRKPLKYLINYKHMFKSQQSQRGWISRVLRTGFC